MASSSAPVHPARYLSVFLVMLIGIYLLVFFTGDKHTAPKLGIDLQGGTRVTLTARTPDGSAPSREALAQAQQIISARVNGLLKQQYTIVIVTHNMQQAARVSDQTAFFNLEAVGKPGRLVEIASTEKIFSNPNQKATEDYISGRFG